MNLYGLASGPVNYYRHKSADRGKCLLKWNVTSLSEIIHSRFDTDIRRGRVRVVFTSTSTATTVVISNPYHVDCGPDRLYALMSHSLFANRISVGDWIASWIFSGTSNDAMRLSHSSRTLFFILCFQLLNSVLCNVPFMILDNCVLLRVASR
jgi:hypothetical protein